MRSLRVSDSASAMRLCGAPSNRGAHASLPFASVRRPERCRLRYAPIGSPGRTAGLGGPGGQTSVSLQSTLFRQLRRRHAADDRQSRVVQLSQVDANLIAQWRDLDEGAGSEPLSEPPLRPSPCASFARPRADRARPGVRSVERGKQTGGARGDRTRSAGRFLPIGARPDGQEPVLAARDVSLRQVLVRGGRAARSRYRGAAGAGLLGSAWRGA